MAVFKAGSTIKGKISDAAFCCQDFPVFQDFCGINRWSCNGHLANGRNTASHGSPTAGEKILAFLNLRAETVSISGGIILFLIAIKMIFPSAEGSSSGLPAGEEPFIVPLAIPLVAGPTILATLMLLSHQYPNQMSHLVIALLIAWGGTFIILLQSSLFLRLLGEKGVNALERLMGLILVMMATQMFLDGIRAWMKG